MTNGAIITILSQISSAEWTRNNGAIYTAGKLCGKLAPVIEAIPKDPGMVAGYERQQSGITDLEPAEFQVALEAFKFFVQKGTIRPNIFTAEVQELLKLTA